MPRKPASRQGPDQELSRLELTVMNEVWQLEECSSSDIVAAVSEHRELAPTTIRTVLTKLREKGYVEVVPSVDRTIRIRASVRRESAMRRMLDRLKRDLFGQSPQRAIAYLLNSKDISDAELEELETLIADRRRKKR